MWDIYRPQIITWIFFPFLVYMSMFLGLVFHSSNAYIYLLTIKSQGLEQEYEQLFIDHDFERHAKIYLVVSIFCSGYLLQYAYMESLEMKDNTFDYLCDYWNFFDMCNLVTNGLFLWALNSSLLFDIRYEEHWVRKIGGISCFFLWIKVFYWMRLFQSAAHFLNLITETVVEIKMFSIMLCIIMLAFGSFFFVLNKATPGGSGDFYAITHPDYDASSEEYAYVENYVNN